MKHDDIRTYASHGRLKAGDRVYFVAEYDPPGPKPHTWQVCEREIKSASDKMIILKASLGFRTRFTPDALGLIFFATKREAIEIFEERCRRAISEAQRSIEDNKRAIEWAIREK